MTKPIHFAVGSRVSARYFTRNVLGSVAEIGTLDGIAAGRVVFDEPFPVSEHEDVSEDWIYAYNVTSMDPGDDGERLYHVIGMNDRTGDKTYLTRSPEPHDAACRIKSKLIPDSRRPKHLRTLLEEVPSSIRA